jgi:RTX calcium-binding nonapeptide repeat (4 copies)
LKRLGRRQRFAARTLVTAGALMAGSLGVTTQISAHAIGGLCQGRPASHPWFDASGQPGPTIIEGTKGDDVIIGSDGDDTIYGNGGNDLICGGPGNDNLNAGPGGDSVLDGGPGDDSLGTIGVVHSVTMIGGTGDDGPNVGDTIATSYISGGPGNDTLQHTGSGHVKMDGGDGFNYCLAQGGDELVNCQY